jgi:hypothetical protein
LSTTAASNGGDAHSAGSACFTSYEIESDGSRGTGIKRRKNSGLAIRGNLRDCSKSSVAKEAHGEFAPFVDATILCGDRRLPNPLLQALHRLVMSLCDLCVYRTDVLLISGRIAGQRERCRGESGTVKKLSSIHSVPA